MIYCLWVFYSSGERIIIDKTITDDRSATADIQLDNNELVSR